MSGKNFSMIQWRSCQSDPPDDEQTVLLFDPKAKGEQVWPGYKEGDIWLWDSGMIAKPTLWTEMPFPVESNPASA